MIGLKEQEENANLIKWLTTDEPVKLSAEEKDRWEKISAMDDLIRKYHRSSEVIKAFEKRFGGTSRTARRYYHLTKFVLGTTHRFNKEYEIMFMIETIDKAISIGLKRKITRDVARLIQMRAKLLKLDEKEAIDPKSLQPHTYILSADPKVLKLDPPSKADITKWLEKSNIPVQLKRGIEKEAIEVSFTEETDAGGN